MDEAITFGPFSLYPAQRRLLRNGQPVQLGSRALELLLMLVEQAGALVRKEELIARVWPDTHVEEVSLRVHVAALRKVLSAGRPGSRDLVNVAGRGYQFVAPITVAAKRAPPAVAARPAHNLPFPLTRVIGRDEEVARIEALLAAERCVTLTGTGGIGKTTVALVVGQHLAPGFADGACLVDLAPLAGGQHVADAIGTAAGAASSGQMSAALLAQILAPKHMLLILDNCEHVAAEVAEVVEALTAGAGRVRILATSRESLRVPAEQVYRLPTLGTPSRTDGLSAAEAMRYPAVELFVERAAASADRFTLDDANAPVIAAICGQLDGLALAIEMAATRMDAFGVGDIAVMLEDRFRVLQRPRRHASARHNSLSATLDWSYDMLRAEQQAMLHAIAAFSGRFTLEDAVAVAGDEDFSRNEAAECLADLVEKSFIMVDLGGAKALYRLYETMREYARQKAAQAAQLETARRRHALHMGGLFCRAETEAEQRKPADWLADYGRYLDDVRAALDWSMRDAGKAGGKAAGEAEVGIALTACAVTLWTHLSLLGELQHRVEQALAAVGAEAANGTAREMKLFAALSYAMVNLYGPTPQGTTACRAALEIARKIGDDSSQAKALLALWNGCFTNGEVRLSLELAEQFMAVATRLGPADVLVGHRMIGSSHFYLGDVAAARRHMEIMVAGYGVTAHDAHMARFGFSQLPSGYGLLGFHLCFQGYFAQAMTATRRSVALALESDHALTICGVLGTSSIPNAIYTGYLDEARRYVEILYDRARSHGLQRWENFACGFDGVISVREGAFEAGLQKLSTSVSRADDWANTRYMFTFSEHALALGRAGRPLDGLQAIEAILERLAGTGERWYVPELHRCRAELLRMGGRDPAEVEVAFRRALSLAGEMGALNWRLLAAKDFAAFLHGRGRQQEGADVLRGVYARFTEGHETPELQQVRSRLAAL